MADILEFKQKELPENELGRNFLNQAVYPALARATNGKPLTIRGVMLPLMIPDIGQESVPVYAPLFDACLDTWEQYHKRHDRGVHVERREHGAIHAQTATTDFGISIAYFPVAIDADTVVKRARSIEFLNVNWRDGVDYAAAEMVLESFVDSCAAKSLDELRSYARDSLFQEITSHSNGKDLLSKVSPAVIEFYNLRGV